MAIKRRIIPFGLLPGVWGLSGKTREKAKAEYQLDGIDLELKIAELELAEFKPTEYELAVARINNKYGKISDYEYESTVARLTGDEVEKRELARLEVEFKHHKITENEYNKGVANIKKEPWVNVIKFEINPTKPTEAGEIELDWNDYFVEELKRNGYQGTTDYVIIHKWFDTLCSAIANETGLVNLAGDIKPPPGKKEYR
jgi:hypothetical protein